MKKSVRTFVAAWLVLVLLLSGLPMAALASGAEAHDHDDCDCVAPAAVGGCTHPVMETSPGKSIKDYDANYHLVIEGIRYTCPTCGFSYVKSTGDSYLQAHNYVTNSQGGISAACLVCGHTKSS